MSHTVRQIFVKNFPNPIQKSAADKFIIYKLLIVLSFSFLTKAFRTIKFPNIVAKLKLNRCWWQILKTKGIGDRVLVTVWRCWWWFWSFIGGSWFYINIRHQHSKDVTKIEILSPTSKNCRQHYSVMITVIFLVIVKWFSDNVKRQHGLVNSRKIGFDFDLIKSWNRILFAFNIQNYMV